jgi:2-amino-4-hydroxy-6-hydroxymethyldihydropteridine diphosphokinase
MFSSIHLLPILLPVLLSLLLLLSSSHLLFLFMLCSRVRIIPTQANPIKGNVVIITRHKTKTQNFDGSIQQLLSSSRRTCAPIGGLPIPRIIPIATYNKQRSSILCSPIVSSLQNKINSHIPKCNSFSDWSKIGRGGGTSTDNFEDDTTTTTNNNNNNNNNNYHHHHDENEKYHYLNDKYNRVMIAIGSNLGNRFKNLQMALHMLKDTSSHDISLPSTKHGMLLPSDNPIDDNNHDDDDDDDDQPLIRIIQTSFLRETPPMYVTNQPSFLNGAIEIETKLSPHLLLKRLKDVESKIGRDLNNGIRNGPRPIDLDIIYFGIVHNNIYNENNKYNDEIHGGIVIQSEKLHIPHPRIMEREFVLSPLCDIGKDIIHPSMNVSSSEMLTTLLEEQQEEQPEAVQVLPLPRGRILSFNQTLIMGILNVTPDSFSDGGNYQGSIDLAVQQALQMIVDGADIIDIGGESTRPGAKEVDIDLELGRTIPVIEKIREGESK